MKFVGGLLAFTVASSSINGFAQSNQGLVKVEQVQAKAPEPARDESSEANRQGKKFSLTAQLLGTGPLPPSLFSFGYTAGLAGGYFIDPQTLIFLEGTTSHSTQIGFWNMFLFPDPTFDRSASSVGLNIKKFLGNSFYIRGGIAYQQSSSRGTYPEFFGPTSTGQLDGASLDGVFAIGNQWQWQTFTMGFDWIGLAQPLTSWVWRDDIITNDNNNARSGQNDERSRLFSGTNIELLNFYLGASF